MLTYRGRFAILAFIVGAAFAAAQPALGDSSTIAGEPTVVAGQQEFGNSTGDTTVTAPWVVSYWGLPVVSGDHVAIAWDVDATIAQSFSLFAEPVGTADGLSLQRLSEDAVGRSGDSLLHGTVHFIAPQTGVMPLAFTMGEAYEGPYDFTVTVQHRVDTQLPLAHTIARRGKLSVGAHDPDGHPLTVPGLTLRLQARVSRGHWKSIGQASPSDGRASVYYVLPRRLRGHVVHIRVRASGGGYFTRVTASSAFRVR